MTAKHRERAKRVLRPTLVGIGSLLDLNGIATYNRMQAMMPTERRSLADSAAAVAALMTPPTSRK